MSCVVGSARTAAYCFMLLLLGAITDVAFAARAAQAQAQAAAQPKEADPRPMRPWCVAKTDLPLDCVHEDVVSCSMAALLSGGSCVKVEPSALPAPTVEVAPEPKKRNVARSKSTTVQQKPATTQQKSSAAQNDKLFREFERWKRTTTN